jgi:hypothetical protein
MFEFDNDLVKSGVLTPEGVWLRRILHLFIDSGYYFEQPNLVIAERSPAIEPLIDIRAFRRVINHFSIWSTLEVEFGRPEVWVNHLTRLVWLDDVFAAQMAGDFVEISMLVKAQLPFLLDDKLFLEAHLVRAPNITLLRDGENRGAIVVHLNVSKGNPWTWITIIQAQIKELLKT